MRRSDREITDFDAVIEVMSRCTVCHVAFGGAATFKRSDDIRAAAAACPEGRILSETDCPFMAPVPLRGLECEPAMVGFSAALVASVREEAGVATGEKTYEALWRNANDLFGLAAGTRA